MYILEKKPHYCLLITLININTNFKALYIIQHFIKNKNAKSIYGSLSYTP